MVCLCAGDVRNALEILFQVEIVHTQIVLVEGAFVYDNEVGS